MRVADGKPARRDRAPCDYLDIFRAKDIETALPSQLASEHVQPPAFEDENLAGIPIGGRGSLARPLHRLSFARTTTSREARS
jgi:hypothetical protein